MSEDESVECIHFEGPCTCGHDEEDHSWGSCGVEGCGCEAGWTE